MFKFISRSFFSVDLLVVFTMSFILQTCSCNKPDQSNGNTVYSPTDGGKNGRVIKVTNLNSKGRGSFRSAVHKTGPRIIVFEVGGVIDLDGNSIDINLPNVTIAGQTAPNPGITFIKGSLNIRGNDVIIKHVTVRPGDADKPPKSGWEKDGISTDGAKNVLIDHCTVSWATDEGISASGPRYKGVDSTSHNVTISNCLIADGLSHSTHSYGEHSKGSLIHDNSRNIVVMRNLYANNQDRNPYYKSGATGIIINNLVYNPGDHAIRSHIVKKEWEKQKEPPPSKVTIIGNVLIPGPNTTAHAFIYGDHAKFYTRDNKIMDNEKNVSLTGGPYQTLKQPPIWHDGIKTLTTDKVYNYVLANAGARPADRSTIEQNIIQKIKGRSGKIIDSQQQVGGYPKLKPTHRALTVPKKNIQKWLAKMADAVEKD